jgi:2-polyprenyl-3-methyl-5-hydroxy-6-metoxy-1,4-benzoquinol methylase
MLKLFSTDSHWESFAKSDPFWAVASFEKFRNENLNQEALQEFFESGEIHIDSILAEIRAQIDPGFEPTSALDFGCGVGRLLIPLAKRMRSVTGIDVSETMLATARSHAETRGLTNIDLVKGDDSLSAVRGTFDLVHSVLVFQHIPVNRGERIVQAMMQRMHPGSVGVLHFTYSRSIESPRPSWRDRWRRLRERLRLISAALRGKPMMQMNDYSISNLFRILQKAGASSTHVSFLDHVDAKGVVLMFRLGSL